jgi:Ni/Co efflux regulator RcnB
MKTFAFAAAAIALIAAPAFAADTTPNATPASATALNPAQHTFKLGQRVPASYVTTKFAITDPEKLGLEKPGFDRRWLLVENNAYLIDTRSDTVVSFAPVKAAQ